MQTSLRPSGPTNDPAALLANAFACYVSMCLAILCATGCFVGNSGGLGLPAVDPVSFANFTSVEGNLFEPENACRDPFGQFWRQKSTLTRKLIFVVFVGLTFAFALSTFVMQDA